MRLPDSCMPRRRQIDLNRSRCAANEDKNSPTQIGVRVSRRWQQRQRWGSELADGMLGPSRTTEKQRSKISNQRATTPRPVGDVARPLSILPPLACAAKDKLRFMLRLCLTLV